MYELQQSRGRAAEPGTKRRDWAKIFITFVLGVGAFTFTVLALGVTILVRPGFDVLLILTFVIAGFFWAAACFTWFSPRLTETSPG